MNVIRLALYVLQVSIFLTVCSLGLQATVADTTFLFRRPALLLRSLLSMDVLMPICAAILAAAFHLHPAVTIALVFLAVSPVPPILPRAQLKLGATSHYIFGLLVSATLLSIITVPVTVEILGSRCGTR